MLNGVKGSPISACASRTKPTPTGTCGARSAQRSAVVEAARISGIFILSIVGLLRSLRAGRRPLENLDLPRTLRRHEGEGALSHLGRSVPVRHGHHHLRYAGDLSRGDHEPARQGLRSVLDPDLPVDLGLAER